LSLFSDDIVLYTGNSKNTTKKPLGQMNSSMLYDKDDTQKSGALIYINSKLSEKDIKKAIHLQQLQK
jgi:hypothetical protein